MPDPNLFIVTLFHLSSSSTFVCDQLRGIANYGMLSIHECFQFKDHSNYFPPFRVSQRTYPFKHQAGWGVICNHSLAVQFQEKSQI